MSSRRWIAAAALCAAASGSVASGGSSYLALDGPPPLRFVSRLKAGEVKTILPPLALTSSDTAASTGQAPEGAVPDATGETTVFGPMPPAPIAPTAPPSEPIIIPPAAMSPQTVLPGYPVTPQLLLSYFGSPGTNGVNPVVLAPVSFVPPQPGASGSSRATYRQVP